MGLSEWRERERENRREKGKRREIERGRVDIPHLILCICAVATLDNVLFDVSQIDQGRKLPPFLARLSRTPDPNRQILVDEEHLGTNGNTVARLPLPDLGPLQEQAIPWLVAMADNIIILLYLCTVQ